MFQGNHCGNRRVRIKPTKNQNERNYGRRWGIEPTCPLCRMALIKDLLFGFRVPG